MINISPKIARMIYAAPFAVFGVLHFMNASALSGMVPSYIPGGIVWVYVTGLVFIGASLSILLEKYTSIGIQALAVQLVVFILLVHLPSLPGSLGNFLKDIALLGGALMLLEKF